MLTALKLHRRLRRSRLWRRSSELGRRWGATTQNFSF